MRQYFRHSKMPFSLYCAPCLLYNCVSAGWKHTTLCLWISGRWIRKIKPGDLCIWE